MLVSCMFNFLTFIKMNTTDLTIYQAYLQGLYGPKYVWFLPGWYHDNWWDNVDNKTKCTPQQIKMAAGNYFGTLEGLIAKDTSQIMTNGKVMVWYGVV